MKNFTFACVVLASCSSDREVRTVPPNDLGIEKVVIERSNTTAGRLLTFRGLDTEGNEIGSGTLLTGRVVFKTEDSPDEGIVVDGGTELTLSVRGKKWSDVSPVDVAHQINEPPDPLLVSFGRIVADEIESEAGITFRTKLPPTERAYALADCNGVTGLFQNGASPLSCCIDFSGSTIYDTIVRTGTNKLGGRAIGQPCNNFGSPCSGTGCYYGPCGGHINSDWTGSVATVVFWPSGYDNCGWDSERDYEGGDYWPYDWDGQGEIGGITGSCTCTTCAAENDPRGPGNSACSHY